MIQVNQVSKRFPLKDAKLVNQNNQHDPRVYGRFFNAVNNVSFYCDKGEVLGLLGANGAGKTTVLRMLSTALKPDSGAIIYDDCDAAVETLSIRKKIGFLSGSTGLYDKLTGRENLAYFAQLYGVNKTQYQQKINDLVEQLAMAHFIDRRFIDYSTGMKQKVAIARAVIHNPDVVILDEPTTGLDIAASEVVLSFIEHLKAQGTPVIFSTHHLAEVERLCDRICVIHQGQSQFEGPVSQLLLQTQEPVLQKAILSVMNADGSVTPPVNTSTAKVEQRHD